tara:strand:- start:17543 stop:17842 length:300 start_codon:yes stop_codon:yes gene_type:complete
MISTWLLCIFLVISIIANGVLAWYCKKLLNYLSHIGDDTKELLFSLAEYEEHLEDVYNRDIFFGEPVLESLMKHTTGTANMIEEFINSNQLSGTELPDE